VHELAHGAEASHSASPWRVFVREERETKTAKSRQWSSTILKLLAPDVSKTIR
jgi:predicted metal-dependent hydrolase